MKSTVSLPPGQFVCEIFPRFGLSQYANRFPANLDSIQISIGGDVFEGFAISEKWGELKRSSQISDFHCVTTWSKPQLNWEGVRFEEFYNKLIRPRLDQKDAIKQVVLSGQDGYKTSLLLEDALNPNVMLADKLDGNSLGIKHGAPLRLVAPAHYGYKNLKHLKAIDFYQNPIKVKQGFLSFMDHPRARVSKEERALGGPGWFFRYLYRPLIKSTVREFDKAMQKYHSSQNSVV